MGTVEIGSDVEIGANATIDRATIGATRVGDGTKIDNLVMVGHNCQIGKHNIIVSQAGVGGSCVTGESVILAGQAGIADHVKIAENSIVGAQAGVHRDIPPNEIYLGSPARPERDAKRTMVAIERLPEMLRTVKRIAARIGLEDEDVTANRRAAG